MTQSLTEEEKAQRRAEELARLEMQAAQWRDDAAQWRTTFMTEAEINAKFFDILERNSVEVMKIQNVLSAQLETEDGARLAKQLAWLDSQLYRVGTLRAAADALLDAAEKFYLIPAGRSVMATDDNGCAIPATGSKKGARPGDEGWVPKYEKITDTDRNIELADQCKAFRRLRDEYKIMEEVIRNRMYLGNKILDELKARNYATGQSEKAR